MSSAGCPMQRTEGRPFLSMLKCLVMPRHSSPVPGAESVLVLPRAACEAPLIASKCFVFSVAWEFFCSLVFFLRGVRTM
jgi:hypothetical protein